MPVATSNTSSNHETSLPFVAQWYQKCSIGLTRRLLRNTTLTYFTTGYLRFLFRPISSAPLTAVDASGSFLRQIRTTPIPVNLDR